MSNTIVLNSKFEIRNIRIMRFVLLCLLVINILFLYPVNQVGSILIIVLTLLLMIALARTKIRINDEMISFSVKRFWGLYKTATRLDYADISQVNYYPKKKNFIIALLPGHGGAQDAEVVFNLVNGKEFLWKFHESKELIDVVLQELGKRVELQSNNSK